MLPITVTTEEESGLCPVRNVIANLNGKWTWLVLLSLEDGPLRFSAIKRMVGDITQRVLTEKLRILERDGHLIRTVRSGPPIEVSYQLTPTGAELVTHLKPLVIWAEASFDAVMKARERYDAQAD